MSHVHTAYGWRDARHTDAHAYTLPAVVRLIKKKSNESGRPLRILDLGCGNGSAAAQLSSLGHSVLAVDVSPDGVEIARAAYPHVRFEVASVYGEGLADAVGHGDFDCVVSLDVVEHLFYPKRLFQQSHALLRKGGLLVVSTPYHGYWKNLAISLLNGWDRHFSVEQDGGHIKFFSKETLTQTARSTGFHNPRFTCVGRLPWLWKSMILAAEK